MNIEEVSDLYSEYFNEVHHKIHNILTTTFTPLDYYIEVSKDGDAGVIVHYHFLVKEHEDLCKLLLSEFI